jgi:hypothetical protein
MAGGAFVAMAVSSGLAAGIIGKIKGSSFFIWFLIGLCVPLIGIVVALAYRWDRDEVRRQCPTCGKVVKLHDAICMRCGAELEFPDEGVVPESVEKRLRAG